MLKKRKQDLEKSRELQFQAHTMTIMLVLPKRKQMTIMLVLPKRKQMTIMLVLPKRKQMTIMLVLPKRKQNLTTISERLASNNTAMR